MDVPSKAVLDVLTYLLPGFVSAAIVYMLTPAVRSVPFERVIQALIYTIIVQALLVLVRAPLVWLGAQGYSMGAWTVGVALVWSVVLAVVVGVITAWADNTDRVHSKLRQWGITYQTSYPSEWFGAFSLNEGYVVLHLKGERRLYGWPEEWPSSPDQGHFVVSEAEWLSGDDRIPLEGVRRILVKAEDVEIVEMMRSVNLSSDTSNG